jgi:hypothetical protein
MRIEVGDYVIILSVRRRAARYPGFPDPNTRGARCLLTMLGMRARRDNSEGRCTRLGLTKAAMEHVPKSYRGGKVAAAHRWVQANHNWRDYIDPMEVSHGN